MNFSEKECSVCGEPISGRTDKTFCSVACRVRAHRQRQVESIDVDFEDVSSTKLTPVTGLLPWHEPAPPASTPLSVVSFQPVSSASHAVGDYMTRYRAEQAAQEAEQKRRHEEALCREVHEHYVQAIEPFLEYEGQRLHMKQLQQLLDVVVDAREDYKQHPHLAQPESVARQRLNDLWDVAQELRETQQEAQSSFFTGQKARYDLTKKWRKQLRERLLE
ncbi:hypothetical protein SAMN02745146_1865 [Hymenobacter daecheongensis DSM 21074]|uniref:DUF2116 family Zn-ribbon domain-containing protein n=1 Tax=Hymenobacter daecheongensis DSM 21074 TaxID=1121955 RepID=A0A1M6EYG3_9BACT|nr:hypothetical protein [Hymenobacter daecheongensis]SHI90462.1 hypothetical protein SAMN02745146_1865 [Hymenobacter daecheongensis DSM 21074]